MSLWETSVQKSPPMTSKLPLHPLGGYRKCSRNRIIEKDKNLNQWLNGPLCSHSGEPLLFFVARLTVVLCGVSVQ